MPPATSCMGGDHEDGATLAAWMPAVPTTTKSARMATLTATIQVSARPIRSARRKFRPVIASDGERDEHMPSDLVPAGREERRAVAAERERVQREHHDVAQPQEHVEAAGQRPRPEGTVEEGDGAPAARVRDGELRVRVGGQQRDHAGDGKRHRRAAVSELHGEPQHGEDAAAHHAADADGHHGPDPDGALPSAHCQSTYSSGRIPGALIPAGPS